MNSDKIISSIKEIYKTYPVPKHLRNHMIHVAAIGKFLCTHLENELVNTKKIEATLLVHDLGNIVKFKFNHTIAQELYSAKEIIFWEKEQAETIKKFGSSASQATLKMITQLGIDKAIIELLTFAAWNHIQEVIDSNNWEAKICCYADYRVGPFGVVPLIERLKDIRKRYATHNNNFDFLEKKYKELETQIFSKMTIKPEDITSTRIQPFEVILQ